MKNKYLYTTFILFLFSLFFTSCNENNPSEKFRVNLNNKWEYSILGEPFPFYDISIEDFNNLSSKLENKTGYIFLKTKFLMPQLYRNKETALYLGKTKIAAKVYLNGHLVGQVGTFPPHEFTEGNKASSFKIPKEFINFYEENTLIICLWCHGYGSISTPIFLSDYDDVSKKTAKDTFKYSKIYLIFSIILFIISLMYFFLFTLRRSEKENISFSLICFCTGCYLFTFFYGEYQFLGGGLLSFLSFEKIFKGTTALLTGYFIVCFIRDFLHYKESQRSKGIRIADTAIAILIPLITHNIPNFRSSLRISFLLILLQFIYPLKMIIESIIKKDKRVVHMLFCFLPIILAVFFQFFAYIFFKQRMDTLALAICWIITIFIFLGILIIHFVQLANEIEYINKNLENLVSERTEALEKEKNRAIQELDLAGFVQKSFYKIDTSELKDWDLKISFKPMSGVSGDLYIAIISENKLEGIGIFDISGHGIASGLVTMLVKNIIEQEFKKGKKHPLDEVMSKINNRIINEKGRIENYLTGMLLRFSKNEIELVNAGHPKAILYQSETDEIKTVEKEGINQFGAIGIADFPVNFETIKFSMKKNDELILYTDGITECINSEKKYFGTDGIVDVFKNNLKYDLDKQINALPEALFKFSGTNKLNDDITYIILKKK